MRRHELGRDAENLVSKLLTRQGFQVIQNLYFYDSSTRRRAQVDLVVVRGSQYWIVEVKRRRTFLGALILSPQQRARLYRCGFTLQSRCEFHGKTFAGLWLVVISGQETDQRVHFIENPW